MSGLIVHEWLEPRGGAERVVDAMRDAFPDASLFALWNDAPEKYLDAQESWIAKTPLRRHKAVALPFLPITWRHVKPKRDELSWLLVSSHLFAHHVAVHDKSGEQIPKFIYAHTPARYIWTPELDERGQSPMVRAFARILKPLDRHRAQEPVAIAANSKFVQERIQRYWHREASVIYPPVDVSRIQKVVDWRNLVVNSEREVLEQLPKEFILGASRFVPYKRLDWVISAAEANDVPVVIAGSGPEASHLRDLAASVKVPVYFVSTPSTELLYALYQRASVFVFPAIEDFGIMPVEAQAAGTPVVTTTIGGARESLQLEMGSTAAYEDSLDAVSDAVARSLGTSAVPTANLSRFDKDTFIRKVQGWVKQ